MLSDNQLEELHAQAWRDFLTNEVEYLRAVQGREPIKFTVYRGKKMPYIGKVRIGNQIFRITSKIGREGPHSLDFEITPEPRG
jgi:DNA-binding IclR family transcriptional regulator